VGGTYSYTINDKTLFSANIYEMMTTAKMEEDSAIAGKIKRNGEQVIKGKK
jgi:hypothetical protein